MSDTGEISKGCLTHYDNRHIQTRVDFLGLCAYDESLFSKERGNKKEEPNQECMAKILRLFETLTDHARTSWQLKAINAKDKGLTIPQEPKQYRFELTNGAIVSLILNTFGESTVRNSIDYLIHLGYIGRYQEKKNSIPVYWLNLHVIQPLLKEQAEKELSGFENTPSNIQGLKSNPKRPKSNPKPVNSDPKPSNSDPLGFENTDNNNSNINNITEINKKDSFAALAPTLSDTSLLDDLTEDDLNIDEEDITDAPTVKVAAIPKGQKHGHTPPSHHPGSPSRDRKPEPMDHPHCPGTLAKREDIAVQQTPSTPSKPAQDSLPVHVETVPEQVVLGNDENESHSQLSPKIDELSTSYAQKPEQQALIAPVPPRQSARQSKKPAQPKPEKEAKPEPTPEESALQERCRSWYERITDWCGGPMTKGGQVINEHKTIKLACQKYSDTQLELIFTYLTTRDWKYSKIDNKYTVRCYILWEEAGRVAQILKEERIHHSPGTVAKSDCRAKLPPPPPTREELRREAV